MPLFPTPEAGPGGCHGQWSKTPPRDPGSPGWIYHPFGPSQVRAGSTNLHPMSHLLQLELNHMPSPGGHNQEGGGIVQCTDGRVPIPMILFTSLGITI